RNLIGRDYTETHYTEDGKRVTTSPKQDHCYYHGHIEGVDDSSVSVGICSGMSHSSEATLDKFLAWRQDDLLLRVKHDNAQFVTWRDFDGDTVGLANKFAMCTGTSGGVNQDHNENPIGLASTIAHEMGHNFGLSHDPRSPCSSHRAGNQMFPELFSSCSLSQLAEFLERAQPSCLQKPTSSRIIAVGPRCGNAIVDPGEECDCGTVKECTNPCCDASTCRLTAGSQCAHGQCCEKCQLKSSRSVCRQSAGNCDLPEFCTGLSSDCPEDSFEMNGKPCYKTLQGSGTVQGYCYNGQCPTREHHCWRLFGPGAQVAPDLCFNLNQPLKRSTAKLWVNAFVLCRDVKCGSMFCEEGGESITGKRASYNTMYVKECKLAVDDDKMRNLDMVPSGTKCAPDKVKLCVDVSAYGKREDCAKKCNNNGVCNHRNECHCNPGWAPPKCNVQYADLPQGTDAAVHLTFTINYEARRLETFSCCCKDFQMKTGHSSGGKLNPSFQEGSGKERPQISQPTFMETTAKQACTPLMGRVTPCRPAPQVRRAARCMQVSMKPLPPSKPLPPLNKTQVSAKAFPQDFI
uniref:ADAM metallopeptidase domain 8b n=1 Tax=Neolamprologus brichardi TaxID=32507 RepID=A0A3Q4I844_NEOBR